ncbi:hypothetical protein SAMD00079811_23170 [Scytonema sp. HK-05]|nr:hypothetical protein SAMD00079811_23170 [Scytonema sp. HK-05]
MNKYIRIYPFLFRSAISCRLQGQLYRRRHAEGNLPIGSQEDKKSCLRKQGLYIKTSLCVYWFQQLQYFIIWRNQISQSWFLTLDSCKKNKNTYFYYCSKTISNSPNLKIILRKVTISGIWDTDSVVSLRPDDKFPLREEGYQ